MSFFLPSTGFLPYRKMLFPYKATNSIGPNSSLEASMFSTSQISRILWNPKFNYHVYKGQPLVLIVDQITAVYMLPSHSFKIHINTPIYA